MTTDDEPIYREGFTDDGKKILAYRNVGRFGHQFVVEESPGIYSLKSGTECGGKAVVKVNTHKNSSVPILGKSIAFDLLTQDPTRFRGVEAVARGKPSGLPPGLAKEPITLCKVRYFDQNGVKTEWMSRSQLGDCLGTLAGDRWINRRLPQQLQIATSSSAYNRVARIQNVVAASVHQELAPVIAALTTAFPQLQIQAPQNFPNPYLSQTLPGLEWNPPSRSNQAPQSSLSWSNAWQMAPTQGPVPSAIWHTSNPSFMPIGEQGSLFQQTSQFQPQLPQSTRLQQPQQGSAQLPQFQSNQFTLPQSTQPSLFNQPQLPQSTQAPQFHSNQFTLPQSTQPSLFNQSQLPQSTQAPHFPQSTQPQLPQPTQSQQSQIKSTQPPQFPPQLPQPKQSQHSQMQSTTQTPQSTQSTQPQQFQLPQHQPQQSTQLPQFQQEVRYPPLLTVEDEVISSSTIRQLAGQKHKSSV